MNMLIIITLQQSGLFKDLSIKYIWVNFLKKYNNSKYVLFFDVIKIQKLKLTLHVKHQHVYQNLKKP